MKNFAWRITQNNIHITIIHYIVKASAGSHIGSLIMICILYLDVRGQDKMNFKYKQVHKSY